MTSGSAPDLAGASGGAGVRAGDFNRDGWVDQLWRSPGDGRLKVGLSSGGSGQPVQEVALPAEPDLNWQVVGVDDFNQDGHSDLLWRHSPSNALRLWQMQGTTLSRVEDLNLNLGDWQLQGVGRFDGTSPSLVLRYENGGYNLLWNYHSGAFTWLPQLPGENLRVEAIADFNADGQTDILWTNGLSNQRSLWQMQGTSVAAQVALPPRSTVTAQTEAEWLPATNSTIANLDEIAAGLSESWAISTPGLRFSNRRFNGLEGASGTFQVSLAQAPTQDVTLTFAPGSYLSVDANGLVSDGTQTSLTFTALDWNQLRTVSFIAEVDDSAANRSATPLAYQLSSGTGGQIDLGAVTNTYSPNPSQFNIDLDFRNDPTGFWTASRRSVAQRAANDWASRIANEWSGFTLNSSLGRLETNTFSLNNGRPYSFTANRHVDDLVVFVNPYQSGTGSSEPAYGGYDAEFGGFSASQPMPRVGQIAISQPLLAPQPDNILYSVVSHELGHVLGLTGLNYTGYNLVSDRNNPAMSQFRGEYSRIGNGGQYVSMQSVEGGDFAHPSGSAYSIMSYGYIYSLTSPTDLDYRMLADSGYRVTGINA